MSDKRQICADNAATTPVSASVMEAMRPYFSDIWGNPSGLYESGRRASKAVYESRQSIAASLGCRENEIYFTSGGTEADNWAIKGFARANRADGRHIVATAFEHHAVLNSLRSLEKEGFSYDLAEPDESGTVSPSSIEKLIRPDTILVCCMAANNEIGSIQPVKEIAAAAHRRGLAFFTDAVQAAGAIPIDIGDIGADMLSISGHKIHAPKGIGALYIKTGTKIDNLIDGGAQERGMRAGTENVPYIAGLARAVTDAADAARAGAEPKRIAAMRDRLAAGLSELPYVRVNGGMEDRLPGNLNMCFEFVEGESLMLLLDMAGIAVSAGSACASRSSKPSHVLKAIGLPDRLIRSSIRFSLGDVNTEEDVDAIIAETKSAVERLRALSPEWEAALRKG
ncbi:MAG: cysteine desulfurase [Clostridiales bacterium]|nr:cysteine desulfurase [Clostridiales bacterium]